MGGLDSAFQPTDSVECIDLAAKKIRPHHPLPKKITRFASSSNASHVFIAGGNTIAREDYRGQGYCSNSVYQSSGLANDWVELPPMPSKRDGCRAVVVDNTLYVLGGFDGSKYLDTVEAINLNAESPEWQTLPSMRTPRGYFGISRLRDTIYVFAGYTGDDKNGVALNSAEEYIIASNKWKELPTMEQCRRACTATLLAERFHVVVGGTTSYDFNGAVDTIEIFDSKTRAWLNDGKNRILLNTPRCHHTADLVGNTLCVVAGASKAKSKKALANIEYLHSDDILAKIGFSKPNPPNIPEIPDGDGTESHVQALTENLGTLHAMRSEFAERVEEWTQFANPEETSQEAVDTERKEFIQSVDSAIKTNEAALLRTTMKPPLIATIPEGLRGEQLRSALDTHMQTLHSTRNDYAQRVERALTLVTRLPKRDQLQLLQEKESFFADVARQLQLTRDRLVASATTAPVIPSPPNGELDDQHREDLERHLEVLYGMRTDYVDTISRWTASSRNNATVQNSIEEKKNQFLETLEIKVAATKQKMSAVDREVRVRQGE